MENIIRIEAKKIPPPPVKQIMLGGLVSFFALFALGFVLKLHDGYEVIDAAKESLYFSMGITIGSIASVSFSASMRYRWHTLVIDGKYIYLNSGATTLWQVRLANLVSISIDKEYPIRSLRLQKYPMVRLKTIYDTFSFDTGIFDKDAIDLMIGTIQKYNPSFYFSS